ncbi:response regulator transcription factor [Alteromonadaceae bacterium BrNp21-10]|nr:response regulator transcription factor [Alteromonadaceae bacterium BrNp21-10]
MAKLNVLVVEDNLQLGQQLVTFLQAQYWSVDFAATGQQALQLIQQQIFDVIVLDVGLPDIDGLEVCQFVKQRLSTNVPVLMLTARDAFEQKQQGFENGADDYLTKPFDLREVVLRCEALAKRKSLHNSYQLQIDDLVLDTRERTARYQSQPLTLTKTGFTLLMTLVEHYPKAVTKTELIHSVWLDEPPATDALKSHIYTVRKALKIAPTLSIRALNGVGFKLEVEHA